jgi:hypothetical protein
MYTGKELNTVNLGGENECTFGTRTFLQPTEGRQYLYHLQFKQKYSENAGTRLTEMGTLAILWKRNLGEMAMLQTVQLEKETPDYRNMKLSLDKIPDTVILEEPFSITCKITNYSDKKMKLVLKMCDTVSLHWCGCSGKDLGKLPPNSSLCFTISLLFLKLGLKSVSGICIKDKLSKKIYYYDDVTDVCVVSSQLI